MKKKNCFLTRNVIDYNFVRGGIFFTKRGKIRFIFGIPFINCDNIKLCKLNTHLPFKI